MSSFGPKVIAVLVPCTLVACADKYRASQYAPGLENESANSEQYRAPNVPAGFNRTPPKVQTVAKNPELRAEIPKIDSPPKLEQPSKPSPNQAHEQEPPVVPIQKRALPTPDLVTHATTPKASETYFEPLPKNPLEKKPAKPLAFRPGIRPGSQLQPLLWEKSKGDSVMWSTYARQIIGDHASQSLLPGADDIEEFCPKYNAIENREMRINFWAYLISAMVEVESGFDPGNRMSEPSLGVDKVTKKQVVSEGLLQLSYQDTKWYPACDFDWEADSKLDADDLRKSILDPFKNLKCGISILANQVKNRRRISLDDGYWSVLRTDGRKYSKVNQIKRRTKQLSFCS
jgi:hypothetical protein